MVDSDTPFVVEVSEPQWDLDWTLTNYPPFGRLYDADGDELPGTICKVNLSTGQVEQWIRRDGAIQYDWMSDRPFKVRKTYKAPLTFVPELSPMVPIDPDLEAIKAQRHCEHKWVGRRVPGYDFYTHEWFEECELCGAERTEVRLNG